MGFFRFCGHQRRFASWFIETQTTVKSSARFSDLAKFSVEVTVTSPSIFESEERVMSEVTETCIICWGSAFSLTIVWFYDHLSILYCMRTS